MKNLKLKSKIVANGYTYEDLSKKTGISQPTIQKAVNGGNINLDTAQAIAKALNTTVDELFNKGKWNEW